MLHYQVTVKPMGLTQYYELQLVNSIRQTLFYHFNQPNDVKNCFREKVSQEEKAKKV